MGESRAARDRAVPGSLTAHPAKTRDGCAALHIALAGGAAGVLTIHPRYPRHSAYHEALELVR
jgi:hypothetical protein